MTGTTVIEDVAAVSFDIGVPQKLMQALIGAHTEESVPSPLNEMYWNWASGYCHFVFNFEDCPTLFNNMGPNMSSGAASAEGNLVFSVK